MLNETILGNLQSLAVNNSGVIPIQIQSQLHWGQYSISLFFASIMTIFLLYTMFNSSVGDFKSFILMRKVKKLTGRKTLMIRHNEEGLFASQHINGENVSLIEKVFSKLKGEDINLIIKSPGGAVFHSLYLSKMFKKYPGKIHVYVPQYSMSGGSLLALSGGMLYMNSHSCLGPVDPQVGDFFNFGSSSGWDEVIRKKSVKASDKAFIYRGVAKKTEKSIRDHIFELTDNKALTKLLVDGRVEHSFQIGPELLVKHGVKVCKIPNMLGRLLSQLVSLKSKKMVMFV